MEEIETKKNPVVGCLIGGLMILAGAAIFQWTSSNVEKAEESVNWPTVNGKIEKSYVKQSKTEKKRRADKDSNPITYEARITYGYDVDGVAYKGRRVFFFATASSDRKKAEKLVAKFKVGDIVDVYYNPADKSEAVLKPGCSDAVWLYYMAALVVGIFGVVACVYSVT